DRQDDARERQSPHLTSRSSGLDRPCLASEAWRRHDLNSARRIMNQAEQASKAEAFRALHRGPRLLLMANAWDAITARLFEAEGFAAVATTSGGVSWALGYADGEAA